LTGTKNYLVTGGAGFIGSHLCQQLLESGKQVVALDNLSTGQEINIQHLKADPNFSCVVGSVLDEELLGELVGDADVVYHLAAAVGVRFVVENLVETLETNTKGTENVLKASETHGKKKVILASTSEVYSKSKSFPHKEDDDLSIGPTNIGRWGYASSKILDEFLALAYFKERGVPVVVVRLFNTVGPRQSARYGMVLPRFVSQATLGEAITVFGDGTQSRCFTYVGDVVKAMVDIAQLPQAVGEVFNLGSDLEIDINSLAALVKETLNSKSSIEHVSYSSAFESDFDDIHRRVPDISKIKAQIDFDPSTDLKWIIREVAKGAQL
jgi:UDP-glucose 4-epimerase